MRVRFKIEPRPYDANIENGQLRRSGDDILRLLGRRRCFVVTTARVRQLWGSTLARSLASAGLPADFLMMPDGERFKTLATVDALAEQMVRAGADRDTLVITLGGGVAGDVGGLLASLYMRGVPLIQIPTTLLAQVDAAVGGKTGVNLRSGKNLLGTFHQPRLVIIDPELLSSLPEREFRAGLYESVKCGVIGDRRLFNIFEKHAGEIRKNNKLLLRVIAASVKLKAAVVNADEREGGLRRVLNFGHTLGHAFEAETGYKKLLHGEAVAWGMIAATRIAEQLRMLSSKEAARIIQTTLRVGPLPPVRVSPKKIVRRLLSDKKSRAGEVHFVLPTRIGEVEVVAGVPDDIVLRAVHELRVLSQ